jgi:hypothetical protein
MKKIIFPILLLGAFTALVFAADFTVPTQALRGTAPISQDLHVTNVNNTVGLTVDKGPAGTANLVEVRHGGVEKFTVRTNSITLPSPTTVSNLTASLPVFSDASKVLVSKSVADTLTALGVASGTGITVANGTVTNAFGFTFSSVPVVISTQIGEDTTLTNVISVTTSNFVLRTSKATQTNKWIAVGAP